MFLKCFNEYYLIFTCFDCFCNLLACKGSLAGKEATVAEPVEARNKRGFDGFSHWLNILQKMHLLLSKRKDIKDTNHEDNFTFSFSVLEH